MNKSDLAIKRHKSSVVSQGKTNSKKKQFLFNNIDNLQFYNQKKNETINTTSLQRNQYAKELEVEAQ